MPSRLAWCLTLLALTSITIQGSHSHRTKYKWTNEHLVELNSAVLSQAVKDFPYIVMYTYGTWCMAAQGMMTRYEELAAQHQIIDTRITFGLLNVKDKAEVEGFALHSVPGIIVFVQGKSHLFEWDDTPNMDEIAAGIEDLLRHEFVWTLPPERFEATRKSETFVLLHAKTDHDYYWEFYKTAENHFRHPVVFYQMDPSPSSELEEGTVYYCRKNQKCQEYSRPEYNIFELYDWVNSLSEELLLDMEKSSLDKIYSLKSSSMVLFYKEEEDTSRFALEEMEKAAETMSNAILVAKCNVDKPQCKQFLTHLDGHWKAKSTPFVRYVVPLHTGSTDSYASYKWKHGSINNPNILKYFKDAVDHKLEVDLLTEHENEAHDADLNGYPVVVSSP